MSAAIGVQSHVAAPHGHPQPAVGADSGGSFVTAAVSPSPPAILHSDSIQTSLVFERSLGDVNAPNRGADQLTYLNSLAAWAVWPKPKA